MAELAGDVLIRPVLNVLREAVEGSWGSWSYFIDNRADGGLLGTIAGLTAAEASRPLAGSTIAAHVHHTAFGMEVASASIQGDKTPRDWAKSWTMTSVDDAAWARLVDQLRSRYEMLRQAIEAHAGSNADALGEAIGAIAHIAYHLGAIRQKVAGLGPD